MIAALCLVAALCLAFFLIGDLLGAGRLLYLCTGVTAAAGLGLIGAYVTADADGAGTPLIMASLIAECAMMVMRLGDVHDRRVRSG